MSFPTVVAIEPYPLKLPTIANVLFKQLSIDVLCLYSVGAFLLNRYEDKAIDVLLLDGSQVSLQLLRNLRDASKQFPVIICVEGDEAFERAHTDTKDIGAVWLYKKDSESFLSLVQLIGDILNHTGS